MLVKDALQAFLLLFGALLGNKVPDLCFALIVDRKNDHKDEDLGSNEKILNCNLRLLIASHVVSFRRERILIGEEDTENAEGDSRKEIYLHVDRAQERGRK